MEPHALSIKFSGKFSGDRSGSYPLTWGQRWMWNLVASRAPHYADLGSSYTVAVPDDCDMSAVSSALTELLNRYETFRSTFPISSDGKPYQLVLSAGTLRVDVRDVAAEDAGTAAHAVETEFNSIPFTLPEISLRAAVICSHGVPKFVVLCTFHMAMDCHGMEPVLDAFRSFLGGRTADAEQPAAHAVMTHPVDRALAESGVDSARRSARGVRFWKQELARFPHDPLPYSGRRPEYPRYKMFAMRSTVVRVVSLQLAAELGVPTASVVHAMAATLIARMTGSRTCGLIMAASHRYDADAMLYPGTLVQGVPVAVDMTDGTPRELISRTHRAGMLAALTGHCDPDELVDALRTSYEPEELRARLACTVNLHLPAPGEGAEPVLPVAGVTRSEAERLLAESRFEYVAGTPVENERLHLAAQGDAEDFFITLRADTAVLTSAGIVDFLRDLEHSLVDCLPESIPNPLR